MSRTRMLAAFFLLISLLGAGWYFFRQSKPVALTPSLTGEVEYCLSCHADLPEISSSHPVQTFGCWICHGGERLALDADLAHSSLRGGRNPFDLQVVEASCGGADCHSGAIADERDHIQRVRMSLQGTYAGAISTMRYTFGAQPDLTARKGIYAIQNSAYQAGEPGVPELMAFNPIEDSNPLLLNFSENCLFCHLTVEAPEASTFTVAEPGAIPGSGLRILTDANAFARLTGCAACHTPVPTGDLGQTLHTLTTDMPYSQCNSCHNRGNYDLREIRFVARGDHPDNRLQDYYQPIAQFVRCEWSLDCIDCHTRQEAMGDGYIRGSKKNAQNTRCYTCHGTMAVPPLAYRIQDSNDLALRMAFLNPVIELEIGDTILITEKGEPRWNIRQLSDGIYELFGKATGQRFIIHPVAMSGCLQKPDQQESRYCHIHHAVER